jgi:pimeloyl-ACP methyl ester carboxylesterase
MKRALMALALLASPAWAQNAATVEARPDAAHPAHAESFVIPAADGKGAMNAHFMLAAGAGAHPTLLLLHGFPGNEQNLDLAQAARRAGWNVLTLHYRGSWGSPGAFTFAHASQDAHTALAFLRDPGHAALYGIDTKRIAVAGHSMGGLMAADVAADDPAVVGLFLIDAWAASKTGAGLATPEGQAAWRAEAAGDVAPLGGATVEGLGKELRENSPRLDLSARVLAYGKRPLAIYGGMRALGQDNLGVLDAAVAAGNKQATGAFWPTDHSFSDSRVALASAFVDWLDRLK